MEVKKGYKQSNVGLIPKDWDVKRFEQATEIVMGQSPSGNSYNKNNIGIALINGPTEFTERFPVKIQWTNTPTKLSKEGDVLICVRGSSTGRINIADDIYCIGRGVAAIRSKSNTSNSLIEYLTTNAIKKILSLTSGSTFPNIDGKSLRNILIALPPTIKEQSDIAAVLSETDSLIANLEKLIAKKEAIKSGVMHSLFNPKNNFQFKPLGDIAFLKKGSQLNRSELSEDGIYAAINGGVEPSGYTNNWNTNENTIAISEGGNSCGYVNFISKKFWSGGHCYTVELRGLSVDKKYLYHLLKYNQKNIMELRVGSGLPNIQKGRLESYKMKILDSLDEQIVVSETLNDIDREIQQLLSKYQKHLQIKQGLVQNLLTGKIRLV